MIPPGLGLHERTRSLLDGADHVGAWMGRVRAIGHGEANPIDAAEATEVARAASPAPHRGETVLPDGMKLGDPVLVLFDEYGSGNVTGSLAESGLDSIAIRRQTERAGEVVVHFPREDYALIAIG